MADKTLKDLFILRLRQMYDAEQRLTKALPKLKKEATSEDLKHAFQAHFEETEAHVDRVVRLFELFGQQAKADTCESIKGIIEDTEDLLGVDIDLAVRDAGIIAAAQEAEHFEIASYGTLRSWAIALENTAAMEICEVTLEDEKNADAKLTQIASTLNLQAAHQPH
jgi:ferritin-like metal-binding protein YciE